MNCVVINLQTEYEKRDRIEKRLQNLNINYEIFDAVKGMDNRYMNNVEIDKDWRDPYTNRVMTQGEVGCALSHYNVWKRALNMSNDITLILEDDADFVHDFNKKLDEILNELSKIEWEVCYLGRKKMTDDGESVSQNLSISGYSYWLVGYLVNRRGLTKLIGNNFEKNLIPVDEYVPILGKASPYMRKYNEFYPHKIKLLTVNHNIINPEKGAFTRSTTESSPTINIEDDRLIILSKYIKIDDNVEHFIESCETYGLKYRLIESDNYLNIVMNLMNSMNDEQIVLLSDNTNVIMTSNTGEILDKYKLFNRSIVLSIENNKFVCLIGKVKDILKILPMLQDIDKLILNYGDMISLDDKNRIFQCLDEENNLEINYGKSRIYNKLYNSYPCYINGNNSNVLLNRYESYLMKKWTDVYGYNRRNMIQYDMSKTVYIFVPSNSKYVNFDEFMKGIFDINYPKENIIITFYNLNKFLVDKLKSMIDINQYKEIQIINDTKKTESEIYNWSVEDCLAKNMDYYFVLSQTCYLNNKNIIKNLITQNKRFIAPLISKESRKWDANFGGNINKSGYYERSFDYDEIVDRKRIGCWNVPFVKWVYLIKGETLRQLRSSYSNIFGQIDMSICKICRDNNISIYVDNLEDYGVMKNISAEVPGTAIYPEFYMFDSNREKWLNTYCHPDFLNAINDWSKLPITELCAFAYDFPLFNTRFCEHLIDEMNNLGEWSSGGNTNEYDKRIGTVENVPTVDIHLKQIGFHDQWNNFIKDYIAKLVSHIYAPYKTRGVHLAFVVKYTTTGQDHLKPHHDAATYSLVITLNRPGIDFQGGGTRFVKQDITHIGTQGHCTIHPGRLTHYHEGVKITGGERYIMVTFVT